MLRTEMPCTVADCVAFVQTKKSGLCVKHNYRFRTYGDTASRRVPYLDRGRTPCSIDECDSHVASLASGYCGRHEYKFKRYGDPLAGRTLTKRGTGGRYVTSSGYVVVYDESRVKTLEHRAVMAAVLGRDLYPFENVHHLNGIRWDNRPENLELWAVPQPQGQRSVDLVAWVIDNYSADVLAALTKDQT